MSGYSDVSGMVVQSASPAVQIGQIATIRQQGETTTVWQDGVMRSEWTSGDASLVVSQIQTPEKYLPGWAIVLGILGLLFFLIGVLFFFVRQTRYVTRYTSTVMVGGYPVVVVESTAPAGEVAPQPIY